MTKTYKIVAGINGKQNVQYKHDGVVYTVALYTGDIIPGYVNEDAPDWRTLEQTLRYAHNEALFLKAWSQATDKGFNLFTTTLVNGKRGEATENGLATAFQLLGVTWTNDEKSQINQILTDNNFTIQI